MVEISSKRSLEIDLLAEKVDSIAKKLVSLIVQKDQVINELNEQRVSFEQKIKEACDQRVGEKDDYIKSLENALAKKDAQISNLRERERELIKWIDHIQSELVKVKSGKRV